MAEEQEGEPVPTDLMGIVVYSYWQRWQGDYSSLKSPPFRDALDVLDHVQSLGVGSLQIMVGDWDAEFARQMRAASEGYGIALEGIVEMPKHEADVSRFDKDIRTALEAGVQLHRSALGDRRYEVFERVSDHQAFLEGAENSLRLAEPILERYGVTVGIENHKDFEAHELAGLLRRFSSEWIGSCVDTGNGLALLEDPLETVEELAPYVVTVHLKDMALRETPEGFELSEVPLGEGICDLPRMIETLRSSRPSVRFHLEMITRDPLSIPCLTPGYWGTFPQKPGPDLARTLRSVREKGADSLPSIRGKGREPILAQEEEAVIASLKYATAELGFSGR
jgi:sugar phosphate isomerase/epimerase